MKRESAVVRRRESSDRDWPGVEVGDRGDLRFHDIEDERSRYEKRPLLRIASFCESQLKPTVL